MGVLNCDNIIVFVHYSLKKHVMIYLTLKSYNQFVVENVPTNEMTCF